MKTLLTICGLIVASFCHGQSAGITNTPPSDAELARQITGTWTKDVPLNLRTYSWTNPVVFSRTISADGSFSEKFGHRDSLVSYQGTWLVKDAELVTTVTNAQGTGNHSAGPVGTVDRCQIIHLDDHQLVYRSGGRTNTYTR